MGKKRKTVRNSTDVKINSSSPFSVVDSECTRVLYEADKGNCLKAVNMMTELRSKYENSQYKSYVYRIQAGVFLTVSSRSNDLNDKERYSRFAIEAAKRALDLSPNTIEYYHFYATLLYKFADECREYEEVIRVCERALSIQDVVDPTTESVNEVQSRVRWVRKQLSILIQKSNVSLFSMFMRDLENGGENFESMPIRRIVDEETFDGKIASVLASLKHQIENNSRRNNSGSLEKGKHGNVTRIVSPVEMMEWVRLFWESMNLDRKRDFLKVKIADLQEHIMSLKEHITIVEALSFCRENNSWHFMVCCFCDKKCSDIEAFTEHVERVHLGSLPLEQLSAFPKYVVNDWVAMICDGSWEPLDLKAAVRVMEERPSDFVDKKSLLREKWPVAFDTQRAELLGKIQTILDCHVKLQCRSESHINFISDYAVTALQNHPQLLRLNVQQTHLGLCFLGAQELLNILKVLKEKADSCERNAYFGASSADTDDSNNLALDALMERIAFSQEDSVVVSIDELSSDNSPETDVLLLLMYANLSNPEEIPSCPPFVSLIEEKAQEGLRIVQQLERDSKRLKVSIEEKLDLLSNQDALPVVEAYLCDLARKKILPETIFQHQILDVKSSLRNMKEELVKTGTTGSDDRFELNAMRCVLDEVESLGSDEVDDSQVREAIRSQRKRFAVEIRKVDARIMSIRAQMRYLLRELARVAKHDFRIIVTPLMKSFLRARLEHLKKVAADELILDCKSNVGSGVDNPKLVSQRKKDSKKKRNRQKNSGPKVTISDDSLDKITKEISPPDDHDEKCPDTDCHDLQLQEEELKRNLELEADERKLEEALECQRQMEYKAKQKCLANEHDCSSPAIRQEETEITSEGTSEGVQLEQALEDNQQTEDRTLQKHHVEQHLEKESCMQNAEFHNIYEVAADNTMDGCTLVFGSVYKGVTLTDLEQQPACGKEPSHDCEPTNSGPKVTNCDNSHDETDVERFLLDEKFPNTEMAPDTEYHDLQLEENEKQVQETLEDQRHVERESKQKSVANEEEASSTEITQEEVEIASEVEQIQKTLKECSKGHDCLICKKQDHLATNCPERNTSQYCLKCGVYGHNMFSCRDDYCSDDLKQVRCYVCNTNGHLCCVDYGSPTKSQLSCYKCGESGHSGPECCIQNDKFHDTSDGAADSTTAKCTSSNGPVNRGAVLTNNQQLPVREEEPGHQNKEPTSLQDSRVDHNGYMKKGTVKWFSNHGQSKAVNVTCPDGAPVQGFTGEYGGVGYGGRRHRGGGRDQCNICGGSGHMARDCMQHIGGGGSGRYGGCGGRGGSGAGLPLKKRPETSDAGNKAIMKVKGMDVPERGLRIILVEHNSFPSVIIQSLWHISRFQDDMQRVSVHAHVDEPFVVCVLCDILVAQNTSSIDKERESHPLTVAIREIVSYFFNKGPVDDASEVLEIILTHFHQVLMPSQDVFVTEPVESNCHKSSINLFKLDVTESMTCYHCGLTSGYRSYTSFSHKISANDLLKAKLKFPSYCFDELLNLVEINHHLACGCGAHNHIVHFLTTSPHVFTTLIQWQNNSGSCEDIARILEAICTSIDVRLLYRGLNPEHRHYLVCMVCYYGQHYCCFGYNEKDGKWIIHDDKTTKMVGEWKDVIVMCKTAKMKPHVLFFEANTD